MTEWLGNDVTTWILPDGDFITGDVLKVDSSRWTYSDFIALDECPKHERVGLAKVIDAIRSSADLSVVEISIRK